MQKASNHPTALQTHTASGDDIASPLHRLTYKPEFNAPSIDAHRALGSPSGRAGAKRLRGLTAPIPPTGYPQIHCTDSSYETAFLHELSAHPSPPPFGRYLSRRERQGLCANFKQPHKPKFIPPSIDTHRTPPWVSLRLPKILGGKLQGFWGKTANILAPEQAITVLKALTFKDICLVRYTFFTEKG